jgi:carbon storage regulator CsrA
MIVVSAFDSFISIFIPTNPQIMSAFFQSKGESIIINGDIRVTVLDIDGDEVVLGIDAPEWMPIEETEPIRSEDELEDWMPLRPR